MSTSFDTNGDSIDINPRSAAEIAGRAVALITLARRGALEEDDAGDEPEAFQRETDRFDLFAWARIELGDRLTVQEWEALQTSVGQLDDDLLELCDSALVSASSLSWAIGVIPNRLPPTLPDDDVNDRLLRWAPQPWSSLQEVTTSARVLNVDVLAAERERAELWHWRTAALPQMVADWTPQDVQSLKETVTEADDVRLISAVDGDFGVDNQSFAKLSADEQVEIAVVAEFRLLAMNWICGFGDDWDSAPLYPD